MQSWLNVSLSRCFWSDMHTGASVGPVQRDVGPDFMNSETGAFLLLLSVVALVVGILVIVKATENSLKEYLGLITPTVSLSSALP
ncbi:hypothetical protein V5799_014203, partial [Amblyomma americanum]